MSNNGKQGEINGTAQFKDISSHWSLTVLPYEMAYSETQYLILLRISSHAPEGIDFHEIRTYHFSSGNS